MEKKNIAITKLLDDAGRKVSQPVFLLLHVSSYSFFVFAHGLGLVRKFLFAVSLVIWFLFLLLSVNIV